MVKRVFDPPFLSDPRFKRWLVSANKEIETIRAAVAGKKGSPALKKSIWQRLKKQFLFFVNNGRCVYCEGIYAAGFYGDAEHYAPKGEVTEERKKIDHPGYYWLAYNWQNLLLSCSFCNSQHPDVENDCSHPGKLCEFPVKKSRALNPCEDSEKWWDELLEEEPLLFHPYHDDPEDHFEAVAEGAIYWKTEKGRITIEICHLNRRELKIARLSDQEKALHRAQSLASGIRSYGSAKTHWFGSDERFSTYLNSLLRAKILEEAKKQEQEIAKLREAAKRSAP